MMLSKKLTCMDERMSCDPSYLAKVKPQWIIMLVWESYGLILESFYSSNWIHLFCQVGRERQRFDFDDIEGVPQKFNL